MPFRCKDHPDKDGAPLTFPDNRSLWMHFTRVHGATGDLESVLGAFRDKIEAIADQASGTPETEVRSAQGARGADPNLTARLGKILDSEIEDMERSKKGIREREDRLTSKEAEERAELLMKAERTKKLDDVATDLGHQLLKERIMAVNAPPPAPAEGGGGGGGLLGTLGEEAQKEAEKMIIKRIKGEDQKQSPIQIDNDSISEILKSVDKGIETWDRGSGRKAKTEDAKLSYERRRQDLTDRRLALREAMLFIKEFETNGKHVDTDQAMRLMAMYIGDTTGLPGGQQAESPPPPPQEEAEDEEKLDVEALAAEVKQEVKTDGPTKKRDRKDKAGEDKRPEEAS